MKIRDQIGHELELNSSPTRIISLVPSQSELLVDLGSEERLVGVTRFCTHPKHLRKSKQIVGGTKDIDFEIIKNLTPDLIICNKEENNKEDVLRLQNEYPTYTSDVNSLEDALNMISALGRLTDSETRVKSITQKIKNDFKKLNNVFSGTIAYLIWNEPIMLAGQKTFIHSIFSHLGFSNFIRDINSRYPVVAPSKLKDKNIEYIFLSSEPYPFKEKNQKQFKSRYPNAKVVLVDGRMFSWYGSCLTHVFDYVKMLKCKIL